MILQQPESRLLVSLGVGLVIGAERERRKESAPGHLAAGIRTFSLVALLGAVAQTLGNPILLLLIVGVVAGAALSSMLRAPPTDPGLTTAFALVLTCLLGALAVTQPSVAIACALCTAALLAFRATLHEAVRSLLSEEELRDALLLGIAALVVLPLLPNQVVDPLEVLNPFRLWRLVVAFMSLSALGYVAQRAVGPRYGLAVAGFGSGFVSSAATVAAMGRRVVREPMSVGPAVAGAAASSVATLIQLAIMIGAADVRLLSRLGWPLGVGGAVALAYAAVQAWRIRGEEVPAERGHAFELTAALLFAGLVTLVSSASVLAMRSLGGAGLLATTALAGFADTHAAGAAAASVSGSGQVSTGLAELAVLLALSANTVTKSVLAATAGTPTYARRVILGLLFMILAVWACYGVATLRG